MTLSLQLGSIALAVISLCAVRSASAQTFQFLPEMNVYSRLTPSIRFNFQAKKTREAGDPRQAEIEPGFDFFLKPLVRSKRSRSSISMTRDPAHCNSTLAFDINLYF